jgi:hypothetical protein
MAKVQYLMRSYLSSAKLCGLHWILPDMKISELGSLLPLDCIFMVGGEAWAS